MNIISDQKYAAFLTKDSLSLTDELQRQIILGAWMPLKKSGVQWTLWLLALAALTTIGGCAQI
jgi:hypothetical protein